MATIYKMKEREGKYQVKIRRTGYSVKTRLFRSLKEARAWARLMEGSLDKRDINDKDNTKYTLTKLVDRYIDVVLTYHRKTLADCMPFVIEEGISATKETVW